MGLCNKLQYAIGNFIYKASSGLLEGNKVTRMALMKGQHEPSTIQSKFTSTFAETCCVIHSKATLSCPDFKAANKKASIEILKSMGKEDVVECIDYLGKQPLSEEEGTYIWVALKEERGSVEEMHDNDLRKLGWIMQAIPVEDISNLTLSEVDTIAALGQFHNLSEAQLQALGERVSIDWANKQPDDYTFYDLMALQHIICGFNHTSILLIHPDSYKDAAATLSTLQGCPPQAMSALALVSQHDQAYGPTPSWTSQQLKNVGCVINGLTAEQIAEIPPVAFEAITPDITPCILPQTIKMVTSSQLAFLTPSAVAALTANQQIQMTYQQQQSIANAYEGAPSSSAFTSPLPLFLFLFIFLFSQVW